MQDVPVVRGTKLYPINSILIIYGYQLWLLILNNAHFECQWKKGGGRAGSFCSKLKPEQKSLTSWELISGERLAEKFQPSLSIGSVCYFKS